ncbi:hypothetical protein BJ508DRAFT_313260 [Ascobolus immersus RN42]|uniref:Uncharacterized protein n=1 Tax=Ascobolus immersus RN42 TaxID=1160509 RepID=A0A3N4HJC6_ASCIM|nr:hypothetical protein BJ508DRAFT_313260 [Ascobolus immersus RN42]
MSSAGTKRVDVAFRRGLPSKLQLALSRILVSANLKPPSLPPRARAEIRERTSSQADLKQQGSSEYMRSKGSSPLQNRKNQLTKETKEKRYIAWDLSKSEPTTYSSRHNASHQAIAENESYSSRKRSSFFQERITTAG